MENLSLITEIQSIQVTVYFLCGVNICAGGRCVTASLKRDDQRYSLLRYLSSLPHPDSPQVEESLLGMHLSTSHAFHNCNFFFSLHKNRYF